MFQHVIAIVSGGASGLGAATSSYLVRHGARVIVVDLPNAHDGFLKLKEETMSMHNNIDDDSVMAGSLEFAAANVTNEDEISSALDRAAELFGEQGELMYRFFLPHFAIRHFPPNRILRFFHPLSVHYAYSFSVNVAINCAGIAPARKTLSVKTDEKDGRTATAHRIHSLDEFAKTMNVNVVGSFNLARLSADRMACRLADVDGLRGCIINTASVAAYDGQVGQVAYASSKGGIVGMTLPMARDLAPLGIRVMTIAPGLFSTPLLAALPDGAIRQLTENIPCPNRLGAPIEYAKLCGSIIQNPYLNGEVIRLDGALRMPP